MIDFDFPQLNYDWLKGFVAKRTDDVLLSDIFDIDSEINSINAQIDQINLKTIPFDKWDVILAFALGILEVAGDFLISDHNQSNSIAHQMSDKKTKLGQAFESIHKKLDHSGQPLDYQGYKFGGGDHRGRTFCHDLLMFPLSLYMLTKGKFIDGYYEDGIFNTVVSALNQRGTEYVGLSGPESLIAYFTHMLADFFSTKSLPLPGFSLLTHFPNRDIRKFACDLYKDGLNLRNLVMQGIPIATVELLTWIYVALRYKNCDYSKEQIKQKKDRLLLISHSLAMSINVGKVIITKEITSLNLPIIIRVVKLTWSEIASKIDMNKKIIVQSYLSTIKNELEVLKTIILLENCVYITKDFDDFILSTKKNYDRNNAERIKVINKNNIEIKSLLEELKINNEENT